MKKAEPGSPAKSESESCMRKRGKERRSAVIGVGADLELLRPPTKRICCGIIPD
jgi:hypothetical protein